MKKLVSAILCFVLLASLAACSGENVPAATAEPTSAPTVTENPTEVPTEAPTDEPVKPTSAPFVPTGYDPHDYLALAAFFGAYSDEYGKTVGKICFFGNDLYDLNNPATWRSTSFGVKWTADGHVSEISYYPYQWNLPAALDLTGFEELTRVHLASGYPDSVTVADCPKLVGEGSMLYTSDAVGEATIETGLVEQLNVGSRTRVLWTLTDENYGFTLELIADGPGTVRAHGSIGEDGYSVSGSALSDWDKEFLGWYDENGNLVESDMFLELGRLEGSHKYTARFASPVTPTPLPDGDFFSEIKPNVPASVDIDGDGSPDPVLLYVKDSDEYGEDNIRVDITLSSQPDTPYVLPCGSQGWNFCMAAVDFDPNDDRVELVLTFDEEDGDFVTYVFRIKDDGSGFDIFKEYIEVVFPKDGDYTSWYFKGIPEGFAFSAADGLYFCERTEILGTCFVLNRFTVTKDGIRHFSEEYLYGSGWDPMTLKRELTVTLENGKTKTLPVGATFIPYATDRATYVKIILEDGSIGTVEVSFGDSGWPVLLNGVEQDEYAEIMYAD